MKEEILKSLEPLFERAEKERLWFRSRYQDIWLTPKELKDAQTNNKLVWGADNWELVNPQEKITQLQKLKSNLDLQIEDMLYRICKG